MEKSTQIDLIKAIEPVIPQATAAIAAARSEMDVLQQRVILSKILLALRSSREEASPLRQSGQQLMRKKFYLQAHPTPGLSKGWF